MTMPRSSLVDLSVTRYYHCTSRCVRQSFLCGPNYEHRKAWLEQRLELLSQNFAISVCSHSFMDNHLHVVVRLDPKRSEGWSDEEVIRHWLAVFTPKKLDLNDAKQVESHVQKILRDPEIAEQLRGRLANLGWFMKTLKEPLARMANREDGCRGHFWDGRYKSVALLDEEAILAAVAYVDLNPLAAGLVETPEESPYTSLRQRVAHARESGKLEALKLAAESSLAASHAAGSFEESHWLCPLDDQRGHGGLREGMIENFSLGNYLILVDYIARLHRQGKAYMSPEVAHILERLGTNPEHWSQSLAKLFSAPHLHGTYFSSSRQKLRDLAQLKGRHHLDNIIPLDACG